MSAERVSEHAQFEAKSPFELRVNLSIEVQESAVKNALKPGDMGFLHSFTTGSAVDGPPVVNGVACTVITPIRGA